MRMMTAASVTIMGAMALGVLAGGAAAPEAKTAAEGEIRRIITEMTAGFNAHDGRAASRMYLPDAALVTVRGDKWQGPAAIEEGLKSVFETRAKNATLRTLNVTVHFLQPDIAFAYVTNEMSGAVAPDGQPLPSHQELSLRVFAKKDGQWRVAAFHNTLVRPFALTPR